MWKINLFNYFHADHRQIQILPCFCPSFCNFYYYCMTLAYNIIS